MRSLQLVGLALWRGGLLLASGWTTYEAVNRLLQYFDLPRLAQVSISLILTGGILVMASLILERVADARAEGDLST